MHLIMVLTFLLLQYTGGPGHRRSWGCSDCSNEHPFFAEQKKFLLFLSKLLLQMIRDFPVKCLHTYIYTFATLSTI